jgi:hypothetical protein
MYRYRTFLINKRDKAEPRTDVAHKLNTVEKLLRTDIGPMTVKWKSYLGLYRSRGHTVHYMGPKDWEGPVKPAETQTSIRLVSHLVRAPNSRRSSGREGGPQAFGT